MKNTSIALSDHWVKFAREQVEAGRYGSTSEVVRDAMRGLEERVKRHEKLMAALDGGAASGWIDDFDMDAYIDAIGDDEADVRKAA